MLSQYDSKYHLGSPMSLASQVQLVGRSCSVEILLTWTRLSHPSGHSCAVKVSATLNLLSRPSGHSCLVRVHAFSPPLLSHPPCGFHRCQSHSLGERYWGYGLTWGHRSLFRRDFHDLRMCRVVTDIGTCHPGVPLT